MEGEPNEPKLKMSLFLNCDSNFNFKQITTWEQAKEKLKKFEKKVLDDSKLAQDCPRQIVETAKQGKRLSYVFRAGEGSKIIEFEFTEQNFSTAFRCCAPPDVHGVRCLSLRFGQLKEVVKLRKIELQKPLGSHALPHAMEGEPNQPKLKMSLFLNRNSNFNFKLITTWEQAKEKLKKFEKKVLEKLDLAQDCPPQIVEAVKQGKRLSYVFKASEGPQIEFNEQNFSRALRCCSPPDEKGVQCLSLWFGRVEEVVELASWQFGDAETIGIWRLCRHLQGHH